MNLSNPKDLRAFLDRHGLGARKVLGQHFLCSAPAVHAIVSRLEGVEGVLEIGPGPGVLTSELSARHRVVALEVDAQMAQLLKESAPRAEVRIEDALRANLRDILQELPTPCAVVSNLPYYITAPLVTRIAEAREHYVKAVLMMQKEVARRFTARPGGSERGSISVYLQALFEITKVADVPAGAFWPPPKVDSTVLEFVPRPDADYPEAFFDFVRQGFSQPRKTLVNNLSGLGKSRVDGALTQAELDVRVRPHELTLEHWLRIWVLLS